MKKLTDKADPDLKETLMCEVRDMDGAWHDKDWTKITEEEFDELLSMVDQTRTAWDNGFTYELKPSGKRFATVYEKADGLVIYVAPFVLD